MIRTAPTATIVHLTMGRPSPLKNDGRVIGCDVYELEKLELGGVTALFIGMGIDEVHLARCRKLLDDFVGRGGVLVACAQVALPYLEGLPPHRPIEHRRPADLEIHSGTAHPVFSGVDPTDLTFRRGVAGFYGRGFYANLPSGAEVLQTIGPVELPLDFVYPLGAGTVLVHGGNDLWGYRDDDTTAARITPQLLEWATVRGAP